MVRLGDEEPADVDVALRLLEGPGTFDGSAACTATGRVADAEAGFGGRNPKLLTGAETSLSSPPRLAVTWPGWA